MRRSIEGLGLVPPGIVVEHQDVGTDRIMVSGRLASLEAGWQTHFELSLFGKTS